MTKLSQLLECISKKVVFIQTHNYPDQDALASAQGLKILLEHFGKQAIICYKGQIDKYNTIKMIELLHMDITPAESIEFRPDDETILVDCQHGNSNVKSYSGRVIACIDHHKIQDTTHYMFHDIRPDVGACATIIADYFYENGISMDPLMATTFSYAIKMDTNMLSRGISELDLQVYCKLFPLSDQSILRQLDSCNLKLKDLLNYHYAIENLRLYKNVALVDVGNNCSEAMLGQISDFILTLREVDFVLSHTFRDNGLKFSARSSSKYIDASMVIRHALSTFGDGGGHSTMAAGFIPNVANENVVSTIATIADERAIAYIGELLDWPKEKKIKSKKHKTLPTVWEQQ